MAIRAPCMFLLSSNQADSNDALRAASAPQTAAMGFEHRGGDDKRQPQSTAVDRKRFDGVLGDDVIGREQGSRSYENIARVRQRGRARQDVNAISLSLALDRLNNRAEGLGTGLAIEHADHNRIGASR